MVRTLLVRGLLVGLLAGALGTLVALVLGEPQIGRAIAFEDVHTATEQVPATFSRTVQSTVGLATGMLLFGLALGGIFALGYAFAQGRLGALGARATSGLVAVAGFVTVVLVPFFKYPANPPAVGEPETIGTRTALYFATLALSICVAGLAIHLGRTLTARLGVWDAAIVATVTFVLLIALVWAVLPPVEEVPADFPATVLWRFRVASLAVQATLWASLGLAFGALTDRDLHRRARPATRAAR